MLKQPPQNIEAEQSVIGGVLLDPTAFWRVSDMIQEQDFYRKDHRMLWQAISEKLHSGQEPDAVTLGEWFEAQGLDELVGGMKYVLHLANTTPSAANIRAYAGIVAEKATLRRLLDASTSIAKLAHSPDGRTIEQVGEEARRLLADTMPIDARAVVSAKQAVKVSLARIHDRYAAGHAGVELSGLDTGIPSLNEATGGLQPKKLYILAARPSMGKSMVAGHIAATAGRNNKRVMIFSLEMASDEWTDRFLSADAHVDSSHIAIPHKAPEETWAKITASIQRIEQWPVFVDDSASQRLASIEARTMQMHAASPLSLLIIDHLGLVDIDDSKNVARQIGLVTKALKGLAKRLDIPVLCLCQLNRDGAGKEPHMVDLRESGRIEEDADGIIMLHRPHYYEPDNSPTPPGYTKAFIRKLRGGKTGTLHWNAAMHIMTVFESEPYSPPMIEPPPKQAGFKKRMPGKPYEARN